MYLPNFIKKLYNSPGAKDYAKLNEICWSESFSKITKRERARADRGGTHFSVVDFNIAHPKLNGASAQHLLTLLSKSVRLTDEFGWINQNHIGVLLFNAGADDACRFASKIRDELSHTVTPLDYSVYTYPDNLSDLNQGNGNNGRGLKNNDSSDEQNSEASEKQLIETELCSASKDIEHSASDTRMNAVRDISSLIVRKMPVWKRCIDIMGASIALVIFFPLFLVIGLLIKIVSPGPIFFSQERIGYGGKKFTFIKFRTMKVNVDTCNHRNYLSDLINGCSDAEDPGKPMAKLDPYDAQIIPFGKFLRNTCLDELPQLINVLRGEMSLVGPRPPISYEVKKYLKWHNGRFDIVPGMTGLWQVSGKNRLTFKEMIRLDIRYSRNLSFLTDIVILLKTPWAIIQEIKYYREQAMFTRKGVEHYV